MPYEIRGKCIFRKDTGAKVGCTEGDVHKYLAALHANVDERVLKENVRKYIKTVLNEALSSLKCPVYKLTNEIINYVKKFNNDEEFLRSGGLTVEMLDRMAFGFSAGDIKTLMPSQLHIKWKDDWNGVKWEQQKSGLSSREWAQKINIDKPIEVSYEHGKFYIEDGHHRFFAAKVLNKPLNVDLEIKEDMKRFYGNLNYDDVMRCIFKQVKNVKTSIKENEVIPPTIPNTMNFWHGGNLDDYNEIIAQKNGRYEYGAGLYLTTKYEVAVKYAKGSRKLYIVSVANGTDINNAFIDLAKAKQFVDTYVLKHLKKEIWKRISNPKYVVDNKVKAHVFNNIILNEKAIKPIYTQYLRSFYVDNGIDYDIVNNPFGWGEKMLVLYNMKKIAHIIQLKPGDKPASYDMLDPKNN